MKTEPKTESDPAVIDVPSGVDPVRVDIADLERLIDEAAERKLAAMVAECLVGYSANVHVGGNKVITFPFEQMDRFVELLGLGPADQDDETALQQYERLRAQGVRPSFSAVPASFRNLGTVPRLLLILAVLSLVAGAFFWLRDAFVEESVPSVVESVVLDDLPVLEEVDDVVEDSSASNAPASVVDAVDIGESGVDEAGASTHVAVAPSAESSDPVWLECAVVAGGWNLRSEPWVADNVVGTTVHGEQCWYDVHFGDEYTWYLLVDGWVAHVAFG